jgi:hypothetical protein
MHGLAWRPCPGCPVHFSDGGAGMRDYDRALHEGDEIRDGVNGVYLVARVKPPAAEGGLGHAWADVASERNRSEHRGGKA